MPRSAIHPGEILADELNELKITPTELSRQISLPANRISQIIDLRVATDTIGREVAALPTKAARRRAGG